MLTLALRLGKATWYLQCQVRYKEMEVRRLNFLEVTPSPIRCLRFSAHTTTPKLAVARADGSIEVRK